MTHQNTTRPAAGHATRTTTPIITTELYEAAFSTTGTHPQCGVTLTRTIEEARQRLADMLIFCDPTTPATADITAILPAPQLRERYDGTAGHIFTQVNAGTPGRTVIANPLPTTGDQADGQR